MPAQKRAIVEELGADALLLPALVGEGLAANNRVKYVFALLQAACAFADHPAGPASSMRVERESAGVEDAALDEVVGETVRCGPGLYSIPAAGDLFGMIRDDMAAMARPVLAGGMEEAAEVRRRLDALLTDLPERPEQPVPAAVLAAMTSGDRKAGDSLHLLVMDLHKLLNRLQGELAEESVEGAQVYGLTDVDRALVTAFMRGVHRTSPLRLDHPGLGTTASRYADALVIQNDVGQTDAHVVVITVRDTTVSITCTDVHMSRLRFFQGMLDAWGLEWADTLSRRTGERFAEDVYHLSVGTYRGEELGDLAEFLTFLGSRLVFLIDWNRARKRLRAFVRNRDAVALLAWAAEREYGHMAFLSLVDERLIHEALDLVGRFPLRYGEPLHVMLGTERATEYFRWVLRTTSEGVRAGTSRLALRDEVRAELARCFRSATQDLVRICEHHAGITTRIAGLVRDATRAAGTGDAGEVAALADRAKQLEHQADEDVVRVRDLARRVEAARFFARLVQTADDMADALEEACFFLTLIRGGPVTPRVVEDLDAMAQVALAQSRALQTALGAIRANDPATGDREALRRFLETVDGMVDLERACDEHLRRAQAAILDETDDPTQVHVTLEVARTVEAATDAAMAAGYALRDHTLETFRE